MNDTQITPSNEWEQRVTEFNAKVDALVKLADSIEVKDQATLIQSADVKISLDSYVKAVAAHFAEELGSAEERFKRIKNQMQSLIAPAKLARDMLVERQRGWMAAEKARAEAETRRLQEAAARQQREQAERDRREAEKEAAEKRRAAVAEINAQLEAGTIGKREAAKRLREAGAEEEAAKATAAAIAEETKNAPPPTVQAAPSIPKVAGVRNQTFYYAEVGDGGVAIHHKYLAAVLNGRGDEAKFLSRIH